jgi:putative transposase
VEKVRAGGRVEHRPLVVAYGVHQSGQPEVIGLDVGAADTEAPWRECLRSLVRRGLCVLRVLVLLAGLPGRAPYPTDTV